MRNIKTLTFAALATISLAVAPAMAQSTTTTNTTQSGVTTAIPGTVNNTTAKMQLPNPTEHRDSTGQSTGTASSAASGGK